MTKTFFISDRAQISMNHVPDELVGAQSGDVVEYEDREWMLIKTQTDAVGGVNLYLIPLERKTT